MKRCTRTVLMTLVMAGLAIIQTPGSARADDDDKKGKDDDDEDKE